MSVSSSRALFIGSLDRYMEGLELVFSLSLSFSTFFLSTNRTEVGFAGLLRLSIPQGDGSSSGSIIPDQSNRFMWTRQIQTAATAAAVAIDFECTKN